jgi:hypothetical protein
MQFMAPPVRVREVRIYLRHVRTRLPFRYGKAEVLGQPYAHLKVRFEPPLTGVSAAALPPLWFDKRPGLTHEETIRELLGALRTAAQVYREAAPDTAFGLHRTCEPEVRRRLVSLNDLSAGFGVALLDAAVVDAVLRLSGRTFHQGLKEELLGFGPLDLPRRPLDRLHVRHTVGLSDPLTGAEGRTRVNDGLPETLEEVIRETGVRYFKVKIWGDPEASLDRLRQISRLLPEDALLTLDGNEQFSSMEAVEEFVRSLHADPGLAGLWRSTLWIEQPVDRAAALEESVAGPLGRIGREKAVIIDESDGRDEAVDRALRLGYRGISAKNCKGVFRTLHSFRRTRESGALLSSEDLMNIPVVPLHQDLAVAAALGIGHSERNGHHYIRAFEYLSPREREAALREFPSLYRARASGAPVVRIERGELDLREINAHGFGVISEPDWETLELSDEV